MTYINRIFYLSCTSCFWDSRSSGIQDEKLDILLGILDKLTTSH